MTAIGSPARAESGLFGDLGEFWTILASFVAREPFCDLETPLEPYKP